MIGGPASGEGNLISGNSGDGIDILGLTASGNTIQGNVIGLDASQSDTFGNSGEGIYISNQASGNLIGGIAAGAGNLVNNDSGVAIDLEDGATSNAIEGNTITTGSNSDDDDDDEGSGSAILVDGASNNTIGGTTAGAGNQIKSGSDGVDIYSATGVAVRGNSIYVNYGLGIYLDSNTNANNVENSPSVTSATLVGTASPAWTIVVDGTLDSTPLTSFSIDLYTSFNSNQTGEVYLTTVKVTTNKLGLADWTANVSPEALTGFCLTATATDPGNNTSQFSDSFILDVDGDGIPDGEEAAATNNGDGNGDGIPDRFQPNVASLYSYTLAAPAGTQFENVSTAFSSGPNPPSQAEVSPYGMISFELAGLTPGQAVTVQILVPSYITFNAYYIYGPTPDDPTPHWDTFAYNGTTGAQVSGQTITLHLVDGQRGDTDLAANGVIQELGVPVEGPQTFVVTNTNDSGPGSLRQAILDANAGPAINNIDFDIGSGPQAIYPLSVLPAITNPVIIDATTQPGYTGTPLITIDGIDNQYLASDPPFVPGGPFDWVGLDITAGDTTVKGLIIQGFGSRNDIPVLGTNQIAVMGGGSGIVLEDNGGDVIEDDVIGQADLTYTNGTGIQINSSNNQIGGPSPLDRNLIVGNEYNGIAIQGGFDDNVIEGNVISGNGGFGIQLGNDADDNVFEGNLIGVAADGTTPEGNGQDGILMIGSSANTIGGTAAGAGNVIAYNGGSTTPGNAAAGFGVAWEGTHDSNIGNSILGNSIFDNASIGIAVVADYDSQTYPLGTPPPVVADAGYRLGGELAGTHAGTLELPNYPNLSSAQLVGGNTVFQGRFNGQPNETYRIEFFSSASFNASSFGDGQTYLGFINVTTDATGNASFTATLPTVNASEGFATATATAPDGATSQFSPRLAIGEVLGSVFVVNTTEDDDDGVADPGHMTLRDAIIAANEHPGLDTIEFDIGSGVQTITLNGDLPAITDPVIIDATTQPGYSGTPLIVLQGTYNYFAELRGPGGLRATPFRRRHHGPRAGVSKLPGRDRRFRVPRWKRHSRLFHRYLRHRHGRANNGLRNRAWQFEQHHRRNHTRCAEPDLERFRRWTRAFRLGQPGRGQPDRNRCHGDEAIGASPRHFHQRR